MIKIKYSPYEVLKLPANVSPKEVKKQYRRLVRQYTPEHAPDKFMAIREAFDFLNDPSTGMIQEFPIYKKPLLEMEKESKEPEVKPSLDWLNQIFETPFHTEYELEKLIKKE